MSTPTKKRRFSVEASVSLETIDHAVAKLQHYPGIVSATRINQQVEVEYDLTVCHYDSLTKSLSELLPLAAEQGLNKLKANWIAFVENNQRQNLTLPAGWSHHVQNLYLTLYPGDKP